jgi:hypothetical protein
MRTTRRKFLRASLAATAAAAFPPVAAHAQVRLPATRRIPSTGEIIPIVGGRGALRRRGAHARRLALDDRSPARIASDQIVEFPPECVMSRMLG